MPDTHAHVPQQRLSKPCEGLLSQLLYLHGGEIMEIVGEAPIWMMLMSFAPSASS